MRARRAGAASPAPGDEARFVDESVFFKLVRIVNLTARPFVETVGKAHRLTLNEWRVMLVLAAHPNSAGQEVADHTGLDKMTVSRSLEGLRRSGRISRREDPADRRRLLITLSAAGRRLYDEIASGGRQRERQLFAALSAAEHAQLGHTLDALIATLLAADGA